MEVRRAFAVAFIACVVVQLILTVWGWIAVPDGSRVVTQWDLGLEPSDTLPKPVALLGVPFVTAAVGFLLLLRGQDLVGPRWVVALSWMLYFGVLALLLGAHSAIVLNAV